MTALSDKNWNRNQPEASRWELAFRGLSSTAVRGRVANVTELVRMTAVTDSVRMAAATVPRAQPRGLPEQQRYQRHQLVGLLLAPAVHDTGWQDKRVYGDRVVHVRLLLECRDLEDHGLRPVDGHVGLGSMAIRQEELRRVAHGGW